MTAARCVGRVGGLAVALGVGAALATAAPAWADTGDSTGSSNRHSGVPARGKIGCQARPVRRLRESGCRQAIVGQLHNEADDDSAG